MAVADERGGWVGRRLVEGVGVTIDDLLVEGCGLPIALEGICGVMTWTSESGSFSKVPLRRPINIMRIKHHEQQIIITEMNENSRINSSSTRLPVP